MARRSLPSFAILWQRHESLYLEVFSIALLKLSREVYVSGDEDAISEKLCLCLNKVCYKFAKSKNIDVRTPVWEGPVQPVAKHELKGGKIRKHPDFTCKCSNPFAVSSEEHEIPLHVECKCLGNPTSASWNLNENYIENGIKRFDCSTHEYGKRASSGIMIGYIISMNPKDILQEVNAHQKKLLPDYPYITFDYSSIPLFQTKQTIKRKYVLPKFFELVHLWINLPSGNLIDL
jgi:hypothetical protein